MADFREFAKTYRTPVILTAVFAVLMLVFAITPDPTTAKSVAPESTFEPTPGPHECVVCAIDRICDPGTSQCVFVDHTPLPCVKSAKMDDQAGFCLPTGAPAAPTLTQNDGTDRQSRKPRKPRTRDNPTVNPYPLDN